MTNAPTFQDLPAITSPAGVPVFVRFDRPHDFRGLREVSHDMQRWDTGAAGYLALETPIVPGGWAYIRIDVTGRTVQDMGGGAYGVRARVTFQSDEAGERVPAWLTVQGGGWADLESLRGPVMSATARADDLRLS